MSMNRLMASVAVLVAAATAAPPALAQKSGGTLRVYQRENPPSASINEEATISTAFPFMGLFNNLVMFDPQKKIEEPRDDRPRSRRELGAWTTPRPSSRSSCAQGVKFHDGKPFTAKDVVCTFDLINGVTEGARKSPRKIWYDNVEKITADSDTQVTFQLKTPQPSLLNLLASGLTPIYPCHVSARDMRTKPIGTGPFKLAEFKSNEIDQARAESRLLEEGLALSRRHRFPHHSEPLDAHPGLPGRRVRPDLRRRRDDPAAEGRGCAARRRRSASSTRPAPTPT